MGALLGIIPYNWWSGSLVSKVSRRVVRLADRLGRNMISSRKSDIQSRLLSMKQVIDLIINDNSEVDSHKVLKYFTLERRMMCGFFEYRNHKP